MSADQPDKPPVEAPLGQLERALIDEFLRMRGCDHAGLSQLPEGEQEALLKEASLYASAKMAEVETRSRFVHEIHDGAPGLSKTGLE